VSFKLTKQECNLDKNLGLLKRKIKEVFLAKPPGLGLSRKFKRSPQTLQRRLTPPLEKRKYLGPGLDSKKVCGTLLRRTLKTQSSSKKD